MPIDDLLPLPCGPARATQAAKAAAPPPPGRCDGLAFVMRSGAPPPTVTFSEVAADGLAAGLRFTAASNVAPPELDPATNGLAIQIGGPIFGETILDAVLPPGSSWTRPDAGSWTYRDQTGRIAGITDVSVRPMEGGGLAWELRGQRGRYRASSGRAAGTTW